MKLWILNKWNAGDQVLRCFVLILLSACLTLKAPVLYAFQNNNGVGAGGLPSNVPTNMPATTPDSFQATAPVLTFQDSTGQIYGRYIVNEAVPTLAYGQKQVVERVWLPKTVTEQRAVTQVQYNPVYVYQPQLRNVYSWNPFATPQQVWQYVPVVQYQPTYTQVNQPVTYVRYEEQEVVKVVPELQMQTRQAGRFADRPLMGGQFGSNVVASNAYSTPIQPSGVPNPYQQNAVLAQANRNASNLPIRPIDYPYPSNGSQNALARNMAWNVPPAYYLNPAATNPGMNSMPVNNVASSPAINTMPSSGTGYTYTTVVPMVAMNSATSTGAPGAYGAAYSPASGYSTTAGIPRMQWPSFTNGTGSLFGSSLFANGRTPQYVASNPWGASPYSSSTGATWPTSSSMAGFRPNSSPIVYPSNAWGVSTSQGNRDSMQGGMMATELR